jgi:hypothetical protein
VWSKHAFRILGLTALGLVATATVAHHYLEQWSWIDSLYFSVVAGTTWDSVTWHQRQMPPSCSPSAI